MKRFLQRLHDRIGDFWWYSLMIFIAARTADFINAFVGLWLVPKYVPPSELGAVQPLMNFATFLAMPIAAFASTFRQELSNLALTEQFGRLKTLMKTVFIAVAVFLFVAMVVSHFLLPHFLLRIRVVEGSLGLVILANSFVSALAPIFNNALQSLKKFKATTAINILGAPIRLIAMLLTLPLRALTGYIVGQTSTPVFTILASIVALRKELSVPAEPYWTRPTVVKFARLFAIFAVSSIIGGFTTLTETTILRQRLPELESAAFYMTSRFSDIAQFVSLTLLFTIFPFSAEQAAKGRDTRPLMFKVALVIFAAAALLATFFACFGSTILRLLPNGAVYAPFSWAIPFTIAILMVQAITALYSSIEIAANRFGYLWWNIPLHLVYTLVLLAVTGNGYYIHLLPESAARLVQAVNITSLAGMLTWMLGLQLLKLIFSCADLCFRKSA